jgi:hypothetical protein
VVALGVSELGAEAVQPLGEGISPPEVDTFERAVTLTLIVTRVPEGAACLGADLGAAERLLDPAERQVRFPAHASIVRRGDRPRVRVDQENASPAYW